VLECPETVPLSWYMKPSDLERLVSWTQFNDPFLHAIHRGAGRFDATTPVGNLQLSYYENLLRLAGLLGESHGTDGSAD
jgi:hypothetical protein